MSQFQPPHMPPMSPPPPPMMQGYGQYGAPMPRRTSGAAITSLVCGIVGCVPFITSLLAIIFAIVGLRRTRDPQYSGRGLAVAGLILGILGMLGWTVIGGGAFAIYRAGAPASRVAQQFTQALSQGSVSLAASQCETSITPAELQTTADDLSALGTLQDLRLPSRNIFRLNGQTTWMLTGYATFNSGTKSAMFKLRKQPDGSYKIFEYHLQ